uniref:Uncharacterized protein n=1 Tax=Arundo donax TaxID=35708 RepID=A0A0A8YZH0_ARUDO
MSISCLASHQVILKGS